MNTEIPDLTNPALIIALTQCAVCPQTIPQNFAITKKILSDVEHFCSEQCCLWFEEDIDDQALARLREAGL